MAVCDILGVQHGLIEGPGMRQTLGPLGRREMTRYFWSPDDPFRHLFRDGTRDRRFPKLRVYEQEVAENRGSISFLTVRYVDEITWDETKGSRYARGLVRVGTQLQSGSITILGWNNGNEVLISLPVVYASGTKTYVSYHNLKEAELRTRPATPPPFQPPAAEVLWYDFTSLRTERNGRLIQEIKKYIGLRLKTRWIKTDDSGEESGGYWRRNETWGAIQIPEILSVYGNLDMTG